MTPSTEAGKTGQEPTRGKKTSSVWDTLMGQVKVIPTGCPADVGLFVQTCPAGVPFPLPHTSSLLGWSDPGQWSRTALSSQYPSAIYCDLGTPGHKLSWVSWPKKHVPESK